MVSSGISQDSVVNSASRALRLALLVCLALGIPSNGLSQAASEYQLKAEFIYNFAKFVVWPPATFPTPSDSFGMCVYERNPISAVLERDMQGKTVQGRRIAVKTVVNIGEARACQILFIGQIKKATLNDLLKDLQGAPVLTVGEAPGFTQAGGMINLAVESGQLRFVVNNGAARKVGLKISSRLLSLAKRVTD